MKPFALRDEFRRYPNCIAYNMIPFPLYPASLCTQQFWASHLTQPFPFAEATLLIQKISDTPTLLLRPTSSKIDNFCFSSCRTSLTPSNHSFPEAAGPPPSSSSLAKASLLYLLPNSSHSALFLSHVTNGSRRGTVQRCTRLRRRANTYSHLTSSTFSPVIGLWLPASF